MNIDRPRSHSHHVLRGIQLAYRHRKLIHHAGRSAARWLKSKRSAARHHGHHHENHGHNTDMGGEMSNDYHSIIVKHKIPRGVSGEVNQLFWDQNSTFGGPTGLAGWNTVLVINAPSQWLTSSGNYGVGQADIRWLDMNPNAINTGSSLYGPQTALLNDRYGLLKSKVYMDIGNMANTGVIVKVHVYECKKPTNDGPLRCWTTENVSNAVGAGAFTNPVVNTTNLPAATSGAGGATSLTVTGYQETCNSFIGVYPELNKATKTFWKKKKIINFSLGSGSSHRIQFNCIHNYICNRGQLSEEALAYTKGTLVFIFESYGEVTRVQDAVYTATHAATVLSVVSKVKSDFKPVKENAARLFTQFLYSREASTTTNALKTFNDDELAVNVASL